MKDEQFYFTSGGIVLIIGLLLAKYLIPIEKAGNIRGTVVLGDEAGERDGILGLDIFHLVHYPFNLPGSICNIKFNICQYGGTSDPVYMLMKQT